MIKRGDLVMIVRVTHDCYAKYIGIPFVVVHAGSNSGMVCDFCGKGFFDGAIASSDGDISKAIGGLQSWMIKLDPPSTGELSGAPLKIKEPA